MPTIGTLTCSTDDPTVEIANVAQLDDWLNRLEGRCSPGFPGIVRLCVHGYQVEIGLGLAESFVTIGHESGMAAYRTTLGDPTAEGTVDFYMFGGRPSKISRRNLVPAPQARQVISEFFTTGERPASVQWEKTSG